MARGRKTKERKGYFYETEEQAVIDYINSENTEEKNKIFNIVLFPAFTKMIESIIRRYKLYVPDEAFEQTFDDTISYLMTKINHYRPIIFEYEEIPVLPENILPEIIQESDKKEFFKNANNDSPNYIIVVNDDDITPFELKTKKYKAFSYCQTICKNYLMFKGMQYVTKQQRNLPYESDVFENNYKYSEEESENYSFAERMIEKTYDEIQNMVNNPQAFSLNENEIKVGMALVELLKNWETLITDDGSNKLRKNKVLYFLREETMMTTKGVRDNMKPFKNLYYIIKEKELQ